MTPLEQRKKALTKAIFSLFYVWLVMSLSMNAVLGLGLFVTKKWLPLFVLLLLLAVLMMTRNFKRKGVSVCYRIPGANIMILFISALIMIIINAIGMNWEPVWVKPQPHNELIPYVSTLIVYPVAFFVSLWYLSIGFKAIACVHCHVRHGSHTERGLLARLFQQESIMQLKVLCIYSLLISIVDWIYYFLYYININYNSPDIFFFAVIPTVVTILTIAFFYVRYMGMWRHYCLNPALDAVHGNSTCVRYIIIVGDHLLLDLYNDVVVDTPVKCFVPFTSEFSMERAEKTFMDLTGIKAQDLRLAYESEETTTLANTFHYLCFFDSVREIQGSKIQGQLYSYQRVVEMIKSKLMAQELRSELERIYTVAMTWKTYTPEGKRIYPVKHYRPSFRFRDIKGYKVDYNDRRWLAVTVNNEDKRFYRLRRFWNKHMNGF